MKLKHDSQVDQKYFCSREIIYNKPPSNIPGTEIISTNIFQFSSLVFGTVHSAADKRNQKFISPLQYLPLHPNRAKRSKAFSP